jgi:hypothetical protein
VHVSASNLALHRGGTNKTFALWAFVLVSCVSTVEGGEAWRDAHSPASTSGLPPRPCLLLTLHYQAPTSRGWRTIAGARNKSMLCFPKTPASSWWCPFAHASAVSGPLFSRAHAHCDGWWDARSFGLGRSSGSGRYETPKTACPSWILEPHCAWERVRGHISALVSFHLSHTRPSARTFCEHDNMRGVSAAQAVYMRCPTVPHTHIHIKCTLSKAREREREPLSRAAYRSFDGRWRW